MGRSEWGRRRGGRIGDQSSKRGWVDGWMVGGSERRLFRGEVG